MAKEIDEKEEDIVPGQEIDFCTMGMFIIGEFTRLSVPADLPCIGFTAVNVRTLPLNMRVRGSGSLVMNLRYSFLKDVIDVAWSCYERHSSKIECSTNSKYLRVRLTSHEP